MLEGVLIGLGGTIAGEPPKIGNTRLRNDRADRNVAKTMRATIGTGTRETKEPGQTLAQARLQFQLAQPAVACARRLDRRACSAAA